MKEIRLGTIGSGSIVDGFLEAVAATEGIEVGAVYSRTEERGRALAERHGVEKVYTGLDAFFADSDIDTVYIASPNLLHYEQARLALCAGKHVIVEKPFCVRAAEAEGLLALARDRGLFLAEAIVPPCLPNYAILRRELPKLGRIRIVSANYSQYSSRYDALLAGELPNIFALEWGGGSLMDINYYNVALNVLLFGKPRRVDYYPNLPKGAADTSGVLVLDYGGFVSANVGAKDAAGENFFQIEGEKGWIRIENGANAMSRIRVVTEGSDQTFDEQEDARRLCYEVSALTALWRSGDRAQAYERLRATLAAVEVVEGARKSAGIFFPGDEENGR